MNKVIIVIGSSVREHVICSKLKKQKIIVISDFLNPKINDLCFQYIVTNLDNQSILNYIPPLIKNIFNRVCCYQSRKIYF